MRVEFSRVFAIAIVDVEQMKYNSGTPRIVGTETDRRCSSKHPKRVSERTNIINGLVDTGTLLESSVPIPVLPYNFKHRRIGEGGGRVGILRIHEKMFCFEPCARVDIGRCTTDRYPTVIEVLVPSSYFVTDSDLKQSLSIRSGIYVFLHGLLSPPVKNQYFPEQQYTNYNTESRRKKD